MGLISEKTEAFYVELNERAEAATSIYSAPGDFSQYIYSVLEAMKRSNQDAWFMNFPSQILIMVIEQLYFSLQIKKPPALCGHK